MSVSVSQNCVSSFAETEELIRSYPEVVTRFEGQLYGFALMLTSDMACAENILCESFIKVFEAISTGRISSERELRKSLFQTAHQLVAADGASNSNRQIKESDAEEIALKSVRCGKSNKYILADVIAQMPRRLKLVFILKDIYGFARAEIAEILKTDFGEVKTTLHRARMISRASVGRYLA